jgi:hypothetical protein
MSQLYTVTGHSGVQPRNKLLLGLFIAALPTAQINRLQQKFPTFPDMLTDKTSLRFHSLVACPTLYV